MKIQVDDKEFEQMLEYDQIEKRIRMLAVQLNVDYQNKTPLFIGVLNGSFIFMADLMKEINISSEVTFVKVSSYLKDESSGMVKEIMGLDADLKGRDVIVVEDIVDTARTAKFLLKIIKERQPASVALCSLLYKPNASLETIEELKYTGFEIPNDFVVGYGLDYNGLGRNLKGIYRAVPVPSET